MIVDRPADGAQQDAPEPGLDTITIHATSTGTGDRDNSMWHLLEPRQQYMGGLAIQGLDGQLDDGMIEGSSLASMNPLAAFNIPDMQPDEPARLGPAPELNHPGQTSGIRLMSESLAVDTPKFFWETDPFLKEIFGGRQHLTGVFNSLELKRPALGVIDVESLEEEPPIVQAMKRRQTKPIPLHARVLKHIGPRIPRQKEQVSFLTGAHWWR